MSALNNQMLAWMNAERDCSWQDEAKHLKIRDKLIVQLQQEPNNNITDSDIEHLWWILNRMIKIHNENKNVDYMKRFGRIINKLGAI